MNLRIDLHGTGWKKDPEDERDLDAGILLGLAPIGGDEPPATERVNHADEVPDILDQGDTNACVGFAVAQAIRLSLRLHGQTDAPLPSPGAIYYWARSIHRDETRDEGTYLRTGIGAVHRFGFPPHYAFPWHPSRVNEDASRLPVMMLAFDQRGTVDSYYRINGAGEKRNEQIRVALRGRHPVVFGTLVDAPFSDHAGARPWRRTSKATGGHAMCIVGFDADGVLVANSWGRGWGQAGFGRIAWAQIGGSDAEDFWIMKSVPRYSQVTP